MIAGFYNSGMKGWLGKVAAKKAWSELQDSPSFVKFKLSGVQGSRRMMLWDVTRKVLGKDTEHYPQEIGDPFRAGTMVTMADGSEKAIETLKIGDQVINHKNEIANVTNVIKKKFTGDMVTVKLKGWHREITATGTHHGMFLPYNTYRFKFKTCERIKFENLTVGDFMLIPYGRECNEEITLDLSQYIKDCEFNDSYIYNSRYKHKVKRFVKVDNKFARFIGLYLAEGGCSKDGQVSFSFHINEQFYMEEVKSYLSEIFGLPSNVIKTGNDNCRRVAVNSPLLKDFLHAIVGNNLHNKHVPSFLFQTSRSIKMDLLKGWLDGDGYKNPQVNAVIGYTSSTQLGVDMLRIATSCKLNAKSWSRMRKTRAKVPNTELAFYGTESLQVYEGATSPIATKKITCNDTPWGFARKITQITKEHVVDEEVYCITTENEYTAIFNGIAQYQCVSFGGKNAIEYLICTEMLMKGERETFKSIFPPYLYGTGRVFVGGGQISGDGSLGSWMAEAVIKYGAIPSDTEDCPKYSGSIARQWGNRPGPPSKFVEVGKIHPVKSAAQINSWDELVTAICNGYPCTVASNQGFNMEASRDGFHAPSGSWAHQMCIIGVDDESNDPYAIILNNWGDAHGRLKDFTTNEDLPIGVLRVRKKTIEKMIDAGETFAFSNFEGFPDQPIEKELFKLI